MIKAFNYSPRTRIVNYNRDTQGHITQPNQRPNGTHSKSWVAVQPTKIAVFWQNLWKVVNERRLRDVFLLRSSQTLSFVKSPTMFNKPLLQRALPHLGAQLQILGALQQLLGALLPPWWQTHSSSPRLLQRSKLPKQKGKFEVRYLYCAEQTYKM